MTLRTTLRGLLFFPFLLLAATPARAQVWAERTAIAPSTATLGQGYGGAIDLDGSTLVVGAPFEYVASTLEAGAAYVVTGSGDAWTEVTRLVPTTTTPSRFGMSVAVSGDRIAILANANDGGTGAVYVYSLVAGAWTFDARLAPASAGVVWGGGVALDGDTIVVGGSEPGATAGDPRLGIATVLVRGSAGTWSEQARLAAGDAQPGDTFGSAVAVQGDVAIVGASQHDVGTARAAGAAYAFVRGGTVWTQEQRLVAGDGVMNDAFGFSVALDAGTAVIGAIGVGSGTGAAYVDVRSGTTWTEQAKLVPGGSPFNERIGSSVAIRGDHAVAGAYYHTSTGASDAGAAYSFVRSGTSWTFDGALYRPSPRTNDYLGSSVAITADRILSGALNGAGAGGVRSGVVAVFASGLGAGTACSAPFACASGICQDGVCCATDCGGGDATDCQACSVAAGGRTDGMCTPSGSTSICRPSTGACDPAEYCSGIATTCPPPAMSPPGCCLLSSDCDDGDPCTVDDCVATACVRSVDPTCVDAGTMDAGVDAGDADAGVDAGDVDAGSDAGASDGGGGADAGGVDAGAGDAAHGDAATDAGGGGGSRGGCCSAAGTSPSAPGLAVVAVVALMVVARRRRRA